MVGEQKQERRINKREIYGSVFSRVGVVKILSAQYLNEKFILWPWDSSLKFITALVMKEPHNNRADTPLFTGPNLWSEKKKPPEL